MNKFLIATIFAAFIIAASGSIISIARQVSPVTTDPEVDTSTTSGEQVCQQLLTQCESAAKKIKSIDTQEKAEAVCFDLASNGDECAKEVNMNPECWQSCADTCSSYVSNPDAWGFCLSYCKECEISSAKEICSSLDSQCYKVAFNMGSDQALQFCKKLSEADLQAECEEEVERNPDCFDACVQGCSHLTEYPFLWSSCADLCSSCLPHEESDADMDEDSNTDGNGNGDQNSNSNHEPKDGNSNSNHNGNDKNSNSNSNGNSNGNSNENSNKNSNENSNQNSNGGGNNNKNSNENENEDGNGEEGNQGDDGQEGEGEEEGEGAGENEGQNGNDNEKPRHGKGHKGHKKHKGKKKHDEKNGNENGNKNSNQNSNENHNKNSNSNANTNSNKNSNSNKNHNSNSNSNSNKNKNGNTAANANENFEAGTRVLVRLFKLNQQKVVRRKVTGSVSFKPARRTSNVFRKMNI